MDTSHAFEVLQNYKEDASDCASEGISLAGDREGLALDLVMPLRPNSRNVKLHLAPSCANLSCCCRPDLGSAPGEVIVERAAPTLVVAD
ncbi:hypothetical protein Nepgr_006552 [Nepenthes gracilis]|uniref:Uncharacterized protein n=1 Tax=Nepenthes gracilis TaxID=150966 RepID=A0AAD3S604_NEPGR|nr:hypothetical protein Nepgr_006552 [Nepenthes gracilis]